MKVTYISASDGTPLVKTISPNDKRNPSVVNVNSFTRDYTDLQGFFDDLKIYGPQGCQQFRGHFTHDLNNESRSQKYDRNAHTERLSLDFDGLDRRIAFPTIIDSQDVENVAEDIISTLPQEFQNVSYIARASSSFGMHPTKVGVHIEMFLDSFVKPEQLDLLLKKLNMDIPYLADQIVLSANQLALSWPLDVGLSANGKTLNIAPPIFNGVPDPFADPLERLVLVTKANDKLSTSVFQGLDRQALRQQQYAVIKQLRKAIGLRAKEPKTRSIFINNEPMDLLTNTEEMTITIYDDHGDFVHADIGNGDSHSYWWPKNNPTYVFNFKGEPCFKMEQANRSFYAEYKRKYKDLILQSHGLQKGEEPVVFREPLTDTYYSMIYNESKDEIKRFAAISISSIENFLKNWGQDCPDFYPEYELVFDPTTNVQFDSIKGVVNQFRPTKYLKETTLPEGIDSCTEYSTILEKVRWFAPDFYRNIVHVLGDQTDEATHFLNWLAFIMQKREKTQTAWIFLGRTATGKGLFLDKFLIKVFGEYCKTAKTDSIDDDKNGFLEDCLFLFVDEFKETDGKSSSRLHNVIKNLITEKYLTIRHMRQTARTIRNYTNFIFSSNDLDIMKITEDDRRFNIGTRQGSSIQSVYHNIPAALDNEDQLITFCRILNTHEIDIEQVQVLVANESRTQVKKASMSAYEMFFYALQEGHLDYFLQHVEYEHSKDALEHAQARDIVRDWLENVGITSYIKVADLRKIYNFITYKTMDSPKFTSALTKKGVKTSRKRLNGSRAETIEVKWELFEADDIKQAIHEEQKSLTFGASIG